MRWELCRECILAGPDIENTQAESPVPIEDVSATVLYMLDTAIPTDMDGQPVVGAFCEQYRKSHPVKEAPVTEEEISASVPEAEWRSTEDEDAVAEQLRDLGYLD